MEEYSEMNGQNDEQNTGGEFGGSYYQHNAMPREKKSGQNSCAGYILVGILCLLVGIAVGSCTTTLAISGIKEAAESVLPGEDKGSGDNDDSGFSFEWHFGEKKPENNRPAKDEEYEEPEKKQYTGREMPVLDGQVPIISDTVNPAPDIVEQTFEGVVGVNSYEKVKDKDELEGYGSGFVLSSEGYIVTNAHVIKGASKVTVTLPDNDKQEIDAEVVGYDSTMDIAVLYIRKDGLKPLALGSAENVRVGDFTIAIGNPSGSELAGTATFGIISATSRNVNIDGHENEYLQTDAAINPGNSGGPLLNMKGEVIGITTAKNIFAGYDEYGNTISAEGLGFAIPIDKAVEVAEELITQGRQAPELMASAYGFSAHSGRVRHPDGGLFRSFEYRYPRSRRHNNVLCHTVHELHHGAYVRAVFPSAEGHGGKQRDEPGNIHTLRYAFAAGLRPYLQCGRSLSHLRRPLHNSGFRHCNQLRRGIG